MSKKRAFLLHFSISASIVGVVLAVIFFLWYPTPYFKVSGASDVVKILIGVDLVLGPLLTLLLYRPNKPKLLLDMCLIATIQLSALIYGVTTIYQQRPYYAVFAIDRFEVLARKEVSLSGDEYPAFSSKPWRGPIYAVASLPEDPVARSRVLEEVMFEGLPDIDKRPEFWSGYDESSNQVLNRSKPLSVLRVNDDRLRSEISGLAKSYPDTELVYVPVIGRKGALTLVLNAGNRRPVAVLDVDPWELAKTDTAERSSAASH